MTTNILSTLSAKPVDAVLTVEELACALYEGTPHVRNLAEKLARQHGQATALTFFDMTGTVVQGFWMMIASELIEHSREWEANEGSACCLSMRERNRIAALLDSEQETS